MSAVVIKQEQEEEVGVGEVSKSIFAEYNRAQLPHLLGIYYTWLFPYDKYFDWLQYGNKDTFSHREFSFTLKDDIYLRYQSYDSRDALEEGIKKNTPYKIDIGAIFSVKPSMKNRVQPANFKAVKKELVFDIDMTDYDDIRTCCQEANICLRCWKFMTIAVEIIDKALREDFGFQHLLWVYSGRRGVHCWVCDREAMNLSPEARSAIVEYLSLVKGGEQQVQKVKLRSPYHPSIKRADTIIDKYFCELMEEQEFLSTPERWSKMLALLPSNLASSLDQEWKVTPMSSFDRWKRIANDAKPWTVMEMKFQWSYPRLDVNVSKGVNHLLKSPLCIHPKTGRVCVPMDVSQLASFDPLTVPTISQICSEFEANSAFDSKPRKLGYTKTSLKPYIELFSQKFLIPLIRDNNSHRKKGQSLEF